MIRIAFCDGDPSLFDQLSALPETYRARRGADLRCTGFRSPLRLLAEIKSGSRFDLVLLDVALSEMDGIAAAQEIRHYDPAVKIIFVTAPAEFAADRYVAGAYFYQLKPIYEEGFLRLIDRARDALSQKDQHSLILRCKSGISRIELEALTFCEALGHTLILHLSDGRILANAGSIQALAEQLLPFRCFVQPQPGCILNLRYIRDISDRAATLQDLSQIPLPDGGADELRRQYLDYAFARGRTAR